MSVDLQELKRLALAATAGPWEAGPASVSDWNNGSMSMEFISNGDYDPEDPYSCNKNVDNDVKFIAAANPSVILELIAMIEKK